MIRREECDGLSVFTLETASGARLTATDYGARLMQLFVPDREGKLGDVLVGFDTPVEYTGDNPYFGAAVGRVANRIAGARAELGGRVLRLDRNEGDNCLHGGFSGYDRRRFEARIEGEKLIFSLVSPDGDQGFPGTLSLSIAVTFSEDHTLTLDYTAVCDRDTFCNLTNHTYFNLSAGKSATVLDHELRVFSSRVGWYDAGAGTGRLREIAGSPLDFSRPKPIGRDIAKDDPLLSAWGGYDFFYAVDGTGFRRAVSVRDPASGRTLDMSTDMPGVQLYTGNFLDGVAGKGRVYGKHAAFCLEAQGYPYAPNTSAFPSVLLPAGTTYRQTTSYRFGVR